MRPTNPQQIFDVSFPCTVPLRGRFLTLQRTRPTSTPSSGTWDWDLNVREVDVTAAVVVA